MIIAISGQKEVILKIWYHLLTSKRVFVKTSCITHYLVQQALVHLLTHSVVSDLCYLLDCCLPDSSVHDIFQAGILE